MDDRQTLMNRIQVANFVLLEATLFLDTHPNDQKALEYHKKYTMLLKTFMQDYEEKYGPLITANAAGEDRWKWIDEPWPWQNKNSYNFNQNAKGMINPLSNTGAMGVDNDMSIDRLYDRQNGVGGAGYNGRAPANETGRISPTSDPARMNMASDPARMNMASDPAGMNFADPNENLYNSLSGAVSGRYSDPNYVMPPSMMSPMSGTSPASSNMISPAQRYNRYNTYNG